MKRAKMAEEYMPFGRIKRDVLVEARKILQKIGLVHLNPYGSRVYKASPLESYILLVWGNISLQQ